MGLLLSDRDMSARDQHDAVEKGDVSDIAAPPKTGRAFERIGALTKGRSA